MIKLISGAAKLLGGLSATSKVLIATAAAATVALTVTSVYAVWHHEVYRSGYDKAMLDIARADDKAIDRASSLRNSWRACRDLNRSWDQSTGKCQ